MYYHGKSSGTPLCHEFHYEPISTWLKRTRSLLPMRWLLSRHEKWSLQMSLINQHVQLWNLTPLLKFTNIKGFIRGTTLFRWPWRCTTHTILIWIVSSRSVFMFSMINNWEIICPCLFAFSFSNNVLILLFNVLALAFVIERKSTLARDVCSKSPIIIRPHNLHVGNIKGVVGEIASYHKRV
jgi:hypothetical protein